MELGYMWEIAGKNVPNWPIALYVFLTFVSALQIDRTPAGCFDGTEKGLSVFPCIFSMFSTVGQAFSVGGCVPALGSLENPWA